MSSNMFFAALATDFDGTIATNGQVPPEIVKALRLFKETGRSLILVTGRELDDLKAAFPEHDLFDRIVAENGAVLYEPAGRRESDLCAPPPPGFVAELRELQISPLSLGHVIVATWEPNEIKVLDVIKRLGLELQIIFNKGAVMVLPPGINKASGLTAALEEMGLSAANVVAVGDAENDHAFLQVSGCSAAVSNALPQVKETCDIVLNDARGLGVKALMEQIAKDDAAILPTTKFGLALGTAQDGTSILLPTHRGNVLIAGRSAVGKSTIATALSERMSEKKLQFCVLDPEGDFEHLDNAVQVGGATLPPSLSEISDLLRSPHNNLVVNALAVPLEDRPKFFSEFLATLAAVRIRYSRPHWLIVDEAHHVLPQPMDAGQSIPSDLASTIFITVHSDSVANAALNQVQFVVAAGKEAQDVLTSFCAQVGEPSPHCDTLCEERMVLLWDRQAGAPPICVAPKLPAQIHRRHTRKYAHGELGEDKSFYFRGPDNVLNLRAQNLSTFLNIADGVDDATWEFHRNRGDYSSWFATSIKDEQMAEAVATIERDSALDAKSSRLQIRKEIEQRYTKSAEPVH